MISPPISISFNAVQYQNENLALVQDRTYLAGLATKRQ
jgi:hypothetical protein